MRALGATHEPRARTALEALGIPGGASLRARPVAATALGELALALEQSDRRQIIEWLVDRLRDPDSKVRGTAAGGLVMARATEAKDALLAYAATLTYQERVRVERSVAAMTKPAEGELAALRKKLEGLESESRKLGGRVDAIERDRV
jgi:hypothetical protein